MAVLEVDGVDDPIYVHVRPHAWSPHGICSRTAIQDERSVANFRINGTSLLDFILGYDCANDSSCCVSALDVCVCV